MIFFVRFGPPNGVPEKPTEVTTLLPSDISEYARKLPPGKDVAAGGGGGGKHSKSLVT